jgi:hypothetical protein
MKAVKFDARSLLAGSLVGSLIGGSVAYVLARSRARREYEARLDQAVAEVKAHYARPILPRIEDSEDAQVVKLVGTRPGARWSEVIRDTVSPQPVRDPLEGLDDGSLDEESTDEDSGGGRAGEVADGVGGLPALAGAADSVEEAEPDHPFEITEAAFGELAEEGFQQISVTYYEADRTLCDDRDQPIRDVKGTIGTDNPKGLNPELSGDPHIRYVRNRRLEVDFEILLDARSFAETVLGYERPNKQREASPAATKSAK